MQGLDVTIQKLTELYNSKKISHKLITHMCNVGEITTKEYLTIIQWEENQDSKKN